MLYGKRMNVVLLNWNKTRIYIYMFSPFLRSVVLEVFFLPKSHTDQKKEIKLFLFADDIIIYLENPGYLPKKNLRTNI